MTAATADPPESRNQLVTALSIVVGLVTLGVGLLAAGLISGQWAIVSGPIGTVIGALATALNAPSGIGRVLSAAAKSNPTQPPAPSPPEPAP